MTCWSSYVTFILLIQTCSIFGLDSMKSSLTFLIDDTYSMANEIAQVLNSVDEIFESVWTSKQSHIEDFIIVLFNDPYVKLLTKTKDRTTFKTALRTVHVYGGGDCPEYAMTGIKMGIENSLPYSTLYVFTDASAKDYGMFEEVKRLAIKKKIQVTFFLTASCTGRDAVDYVVYRNLAKSTSGEVFNMEKSDIKDILEYVKNNIKGRSNTLLDVTLPPGYGYKFNVLNDKRKVTIPSIARRFGWITHSRDHEDSPRNLKNFNLFRLDMNIIILIQYAVDSKTYDVVISVTGLHPKIEVKDSEGKTVNLKYIVEKKEIAIAEMTDSKTENYVLNVGSETETSLKVLGKTTVNFEHGFSSFPPISLNDTVSRPALDGNVFLSMLVHGDGVKLEAAEIVDINGTVLEVLPLKLIDEDTKFYVSDSFESPKTAFTVSASGHDEKNKLIKRVASTPTEPQPPPDPSTPQIAPRVTITGAPKITTDYNEPLRLKCEAYGYPKPNIIWQEKGKDLILANKVSTIEAPYEYANFLYIEKPNINRTYECIASNILGKESAEIIVETTTFFNVVTAPEAETNIKFGEEGRIVCKVEANPPVTIIWYKDRKPLSNDTNFVISGDMTTLIIKHMDLKTRGAYACDATNDLQKKVYASRVVVSDLASPLIDKKFAELHVVEGQNAELSCRNKGIPKPTIEWYFQRKGERNSILLKETSETLHVNKVTFNDVGTYFCKTKNIVGKDGYAVDLVLQNTPIIKKDDVTTILAKKGDLIDIPCEVKGVPTPTVEWFKNGIQLHSSLGIHVTNSNIKFISAMTSDIGYYTCKATNKFGSSEKNVSVNVYVPVKIKIPDLREITALRGSDITLSCQADGYPTPNIKWLYNPSPGLTKQKDLKSSDMLFDLEDIQEKDQGLYTCEASNIGGSAYLTYEVKVYDPPIIKKPHGDYHTFTTLKGDKELKIPCEATGIPKPTITWKQNDLNIAIGSKWYDVEDGTLIIRDIDEKSQGIYECIAENSFGTDSVKYNTIVNVPPAIEDVNPKTLTSIKGDAELKIPCKVSGNPKPSVIWMKDGSEIYAGTDGYFIEDEALIIRDIDEKYRGTYECLAQNKLGTDAVKYEVIVNVPPYIETSGDTTFEKLVGQNLMLPCSAHGSPEPEIKWIFNSFDKSSSTEILSNKSKFLRFDRLQLKDQGYYTCMASNIVGSDKVMYRVTVNAPPIIADVYPNKIFSPVKGDLALRIMCKATGSPKPTIVWKKDGAVIDFGGRYELEDGTLIIKDIDEKSQGTYVCSAQNTMGTDYKVYEVNVKGFPPISTYSTQMIPRGESADVKCNIPYTTADSLRWYKDGNLIKKGELTLKNTQFRDSGIYSCRVSDMFKSRSAHVQVAVGDKPRFRTHEEGTIYFVEGDDIRLICSIEPIRGVPKPKPPKVTWEHNGEKINRRSLVHRLHMTMDNRGIYTCEVSNDFGTIRRTFNIVSKDCILDTRKDILTKNQPLMFDVTLTWPSFKVNNGLMTIKKDQQFYLYCPGGFHNISSNNVESITCVGETNFEMHGTKLEYNKIKCNGEVMPTVKNTHTRCSYGDTEYLNVGYNVLDQFMEVYDVCVDKENNVPIHTRYELSSAQYGASVNNTKWYEHKLVPLDFDSMYDCDNQARDIPFHTHDGCCFDKRQLVNPKDLRPGVPTTATYSYLNVVPHWSTCNTKNWAEVEERVRNLSKSLGKGLTITTGTAESPDKSSDSYLRDILLHDKRGQKQPAAQYLWKIVQDASSSLVIIQVNVPDLSPAEASSYVHCKDICNRLGWMKGSNWHNTADGYTYCCTVEDFERAFHYPGQFSDSKIAVLIGPYTPIVDTV